MAVQLKAEVREFWDAASCGERYAEGPSRRAQLEAQAQARYDLEPYLRGFARFDGAGRDVLEIGVGMGADHVEWAKSRPRRLTGVDLTPRAVEWTQQRMELYGFSHEVSVGDAEMLPFDDATFDVVYSWGVLHHTPDTVAAFREVRRVLRPGGQARVMIYHRPSIVGYLLWGRHGLAAGDPRRSMADLYAHHLESPGTKGYTVDETNNLLAEFSSADLRVQLSFGDLLEGEVGQQHQGRALRAAKRLWPRRLLRRFAQSRGLYLLIEAHK